MASESENGASPSSLSRRLHSKFPPPRPRYGPAPARYLNEPRGCFHRLLFKALPPPLQTDVPWYSPSLDSRIEEFRKFFTAYTGNDDVDLAQVVHRVRDRAWALMPYPCLGRGWFLLPGLAGLDIWPQVVEAARCGQSILDLGCGLGQDLRMLHSDSGGAGKLYAADGIPEMWELGCELFQDHEKQVAKFLCADLRRYCSTLKKGDVGSIDVIITSGFLDLFDWCGQMDIMQTLPYISHIGTKVIGCAFGTAQHDGSEVSESDRAVTGMFHSPNTFRAFWHDLGSKTLTNWSVECGLIELSDWGFDQDDLACMVQPEPKLLQFVVTRVSL
ncbi:hypothetical protein N7492_009273 [Penicillium capsulatum]|uniref:Methyltransferase domain-containing protein n=1 Tax=Penicillium capsulatum TaxID=69766 RepID=A0A9W9HUB5_9EURO|nr:hypothetical protein N7492_009273 [Penicillium capsulatum]KAJ6106667.1 hypothetical protein N7512_010184 [Penicillium capsulatum]